MNGETRRSGRKRWFVLFLISLMYLIAYLDRVNMSTAAPVISKEFGFDKITMGAIFSAFVWSYALFQIPGGWLGDRFGPRRVLTALHRLLVGHDGAVSPRPPACRHSLPSGSCPASAKRGRFRPRPAPCSFGFRGRNAAWCRAFPIARAAWAPPSPRRSRWRSSRRSAGDGYSTFAARSRLLWSVLWYCTYRNSPEEQRSVSREELAYIRGVDEKGNIKPAPDCTRRRRCHGRRCSVRPICGRSCAPISPMCIACGSS